MSPIHGAAAALTTVLLTGTIWAQAPSSPAPSTPAAPSEPSAKTESSPAPGAESTSAAAPSAPAEGVQPTPAQPAPAETLPAPAVRTEPRVAEPSPTEPGLAADVDPNQELTKQDRSGAVVQTRERPTQVTLSYSTALALGGTRNFAGDFSFAGFGLDWHRRLGERFSAGLSLGWQVLYDKGRDTTVIDSLTITGVQVRHLNTFPLLLSARVLPRGQRHVVAPYLGFGVGAFPSEWRTDIGVLSFSSFSVHFGFVPEIGIQIPTRSVGRLCLGVKYNYAFESGGNPEISYFAFTLGVAR